MSRALLFVLFVLTLLWNATAVAKISIIADDPTPKSLNNLRDPIGVSPDGRYLFEASHESFEGMWWYINIFDLQKDKPPLYLLNGYSGIFTERNTLIWTSIEPETGLQLANPATGKVTTLFRLDEKTIAGLESGLAYPDINPKNGLIACGVGEDIGIINLDRGSIRYLCKGNSPHWSPDGTMLAYQTFKETEDGPQYPFGVVDSDGRQIIEPSEGSIVGWFPGEHPQLLVSRWLKEGWACFRVDMTTRQFQQLPNAYAPSEGAIKISPSGHYVIMLVQQGLLFVDVQLGATQTIKPIYWDDGGIFWGASDNTLFYWSKKGWRKLTLRI